MSGSVDRCRISAAASRRVRSVLALGPLTLVLAGAAAPAHAAEDAPSPTPTRPFAVTEERTPCRDFTPDRRPFFGDLHAHTARSQDASTQDTRTTPDEAYRFARGEALGIQPWDEEGRALRHVQLARPLDFAAVTDHAEQIGEVHICNTPGTEGHDSLVCRLYRSLPRVAFFVMNGRYSMFGSRWGFCGENAEICLAAAGIVWDEHRRAAETAYDRSADCAFTSFVAYEWTAAKGQGGHLHRNVIFRNERVPDLPISVMETGDRALLLWQKLDAECREGKPGCEAITIPHNSNWSAGSAFTSATAPGEPIVAEEVPLRTRYDRLVEMVQHKGESECAMTPGVTDEGCAFEKAPNPFMPIGGADRAIDYTRDALKRGLALERTLGGNPLAFGQIGSTDTHLGTPGLVAERGHPGHGGAGKPGNTVFEDPGLPDFATLNPGGLAVLWAEENSRDALFAAMQRKEAYATSGTRPTFRFFGGWGFDASVCDGPGLASRGYAGGVPMGGDLPPAPPDAAAPTFLLSASRDPHPAGADLERIEIVKGWVENGEQKEIVLTAAGGPNDASVDLSSCERRGRGSTSLCSVWRDPDFDPAEPAFYYARLRENPSCRWTQWACLDAGVRCEEPSTVSEGFEVCCDGSLEPTIQERAWSSPIWYRPPTTE